MGGFLQRPPPPKKRECGEGYGQSETKTNAHRSEVSAGWGGHGSWSSLFGEGLTRTLPLREEMLNLKAEASGTCAASGPQFSMSGMPLLCSLHP